MIVNFRHKGLKQFYENDDPSKLPAEMTERIAILLADLETALRLEDMNRPSYQLHALRGNLRGYHAVTVRANWRIVFRLENGNVHDVGFLDYHKGVAHMPMKNPPHPGAGLRDDLEALGLTVAEAAAGLGVTRQQLHNVISGRSAITPEMALRLEKGIGSTADHWLALQTAYDLAQARLASAKLPIKRFPRKAA